MCACRYMRWVVKDVKQSGFRCVRSNWKTISTTQSRPASKGSVGREGWRGVTEAAGPNLELEILVA